MGVNSVLSLAKLFPHGELKERQLKIKDYQGNVIGSPLIIDGDISLNFDSTYGSVWDATPNNLLNLVSASTGLPSGQTAVQGAQIWQKTEPLTISLTAHLEMVTNGFTDVVQPALILSQLCLPSQDTVLSLGGLFDLAKEEKKVMNVTTLIPPGPNLQTLLKDGGLLQGNWSIKGGHGVYQLEIGWLHLDNMLVKSVNPTFSKTCDELGFPVSCDISFEFTTLLVPTTDMIADIMSAIKPSLLP